MILSADPGIHGGLALYDWRDNSALTARLPVTEHPRNGRPRINTRELLRLCEGFAALAPVACVVEDVHGYGGQNGAAAFVFGQAFGELVACLASAGVSPVFVPPSVWKPALRVPTVKADAVAVARALMPASAYQWPRAGDDGPAEAALIGYYAAHVMGLDGCPGRPAPRPRTKMTKSQLEKAILGGGGDAAAISPAAYPQ